MRFAYITIHFHPPIHEAAMQTCACKTDFFPEIIEIPPASVYIQNRDLTIGYYNQEFCNIFGAPRGRKCHEIFENSPCPCNPCNIEKILHDKESISRTLKDPQGRMFIRRCYPFTDTDGTYKVLGVCVDISRQITAQKILKKNEERYKRLFERTPAMLHSIDPEGKVVSVSDQWLSQLGYTRDEVVDKNFIDFLSENSRRARENTSFPELLRTGACSDVHYQYVSKDGHTTDVLISAVSEKSDSPSGRLILAVSVDVTKRMKTEQALQLIHEDLENQVQKRTEAYLRSVEKLSQEIEERKLTEDALRRSENKYSTLVENSLTGIYIKQDGKIVFANERFCDIHGYSHRDIIGLESWRLVHPSDRERIEEYSKKRLQGLETPSQYEARGITKDHRVIWVVRNNTRIFYKGQPAVLGNIMDITRRKRVEGHLQKSEKELRMLSKQLLTAQENERKRIALELHDTVAQSLVTIKFTLAQKLKQMGNPKLPDGISIESVIDLVQANITEVRRLMTALRPSLLDDLGILATINWHCREFQSIYQDIEIDKYLAIDENDVPKDLKIVIFRILQEAMNNIAKHGQASNILLSLSRENGTIELSVKDNGKGFDYQEALSNVTNTKGLGLVGMRERAELSFGSFSIKSRKNEGTHIQAIWQVS